MIGDKEDRVHGDPEAFAALYDAHAARLHAYCWSLVGDQAPAAVRDVFAAAAYPGGSREPVTPGRRPDREDGVRGSVWLYGRARAECLRRGLVTVMPGRDPLLRAAARLRADQREVLVLAADFRLPDVARVLCVTPATTAQLVQAARARFEQAVLNVLLADSRTPAHEDIIGAFERGALDTLLARRAPAPPPALRRQVVSIAARQMAPLVVISPLQRATPEDEMPKSPRHARVTAPAIGIAAASIAVIVGAVAAGAAQHHEISQADGGQGALGPTSTGAQQQAPPSLVDNSSDPSNRSGPGTGGPSDPAPVDVTPTTSATQPIEDAPAEAPSPAGSNSSAADPSSPAAGASSPDSRNRSSSGGESDDQQSASSSSPDESSSPSETPSSPSGGLLPDLPSIIGGLLPGTASTPSP